MKKRVLQSNTMEGPPTKKAKFRAPDLEDITRMNESRNTNFFRFQIEGLLKEITVTEKHCLKVNTWLNKFNETLKSFPTSKDFEFGNLEWLKKEGLHMPLNLSQFKNLKGSFTFEPPTNVSLVGSMSSKTSLKIERSADVMLIIPKNIVKKQDFSNGAWFLKRALYLAWLAKLLKASGEFSEIKWSLHMNSPLRPILQVKPAGDCQSWTFNLFPVPANDLIKFARIGPLRNNVGPEWFFNKKSVLDEEDKTSTPFINWLLGIDLLMSTHAEYAAQNLTHDHVRNGIKLLKIWFRQRKFDQINGFFNGHILTMYVLHLLESRKLSVQMSAFQIFRITILTISRTSWLNDGPTFVQKVKRDYAKKDFHTHSEVVFVDHTGYLNLATPMFADVFEELQAECSRSIATLEETDATTFGALFINKVDFNKKYDEIININISEVQLAKILKNVDEETKQYLLSHFGYNPRGVWTQIMSTVKKGLDKRLEALTIYKNKSQSWPYGEKEVPCDTNLRLCLLYNESYTDLLTMGPPGDSVEAATFRSFWGDIANLRRFKDGSFNEAVVWGETADTIFNRRRIPLNITQHLLAKCFQIHDVKSMELSFEQLIRTPTITEGTKVGTGEEHNTACIISFDEFTRKLQSLNLPLKVTTTVSPSDVLRHSAVFAPVPTACGSTMNSGKKALISTKANHLPKYKQPIEMMVFFEISGKWPDDLLAIQAIKVEFMCKISGELQKQQITAVVHQDHMNVFWGGYVYRLKVCYRREIYLLRVLENPEDPEQDTKSSMTMEMDIELLPRLTSYMNRMQSTFPSYSSSVRLCKRWLSAQLLVPYFSPLLAELLVCHILMDSKVYRPSRSPRTIFLRFLELLASTDWRATPIIINFLDGFTAKDISEITEKFTSDRDQFPSIFVCTSCEMKHNLNEAGVSKDLTKEQMEKRLRFSSMWSEEGPILPIVARAKMLATAALDLVDNNMFASNFKVESLFRPSFSDFDVVIKLKSNWLTRISERCDNSPIETVSKYEKATPENIPVVEFDPAQIFLQELKDHYGNHALFLHDVHGGGDIGMVWRPTSVQATECKPLSFFGHKLYGFQHEQQVLNLEAILSDVRNMGKNFIKSIQLKTDE